MRWSDVTARMLIRSSDFVCGDAKGDCDVNRVRDLKPIGPCVSRLAAPAEAPLPVLHANSHNHASTAA